MSKIELMFGLGWMAGIVSALGLLWLGSWAIEKWCKTTPEEHAYAHWTKLAKGFANGMPLEGIDGANYQTMLTLLGNPKACHYYWECWRNGIRIPPPPPYELVFSNNPEPPAAETHHNQT